LQQLQQIKQLSNLNILLGFAAGSNFAIFECLFGEPAVAVF
jgi:hypothetical protein